MQESHLAGPCPQQKEGIVLHRHFPEKCSGAPLHVRKLPQKPARQIDEMQSLIDGFAAARNFWNGAPFFLVARPAAVAISPSDEHQLAQNTAIQDLPRLAKGPVVPVIEAYPHQRSRAAHRL